MFTRLCIVCVYRYTRKLPPSAGFPSPFGGVASPAPPLGALPTLVWRPPPSAAVKGKYNINNLGQRWRPGRGVSLAYAAFGGNKNIEKKISGASGAPFRECLQCPKWF